jgi:DNA-binding protein H-NS
VQDPRLADHAVGLELQLAELVEQRERAVVQDRPADAARLQQLIDAVQAELAQTAEQLAQSAAPPLVHDATPAAS